MTHSPRSRRPAGALRIEVLEPRLTPAVTVGNDAFEVVQNTPLVIASGVTPSAESGFNDQSGINSNPTANTPFTFGDTIHGRGEGEPGWGNGWRVSDGGSDSGYHLGLAESAAAFEGDGVLHATPSFHIGETWIYRPLAQPQFDKFIMDQWVRLPANGFMFIRLGGPGGDGPAWDARNGKFWANDGNGQGSVFGEDSGFAIQPLAWHRVTLVVNVPSQTYQFFVDGRRYEAPDPLNFRYQPTSITSINFLIHTDIWIDAVRFAPLTSTPTQGVLANDTSSSGPLYAFLTSGPANGQLQFRQDGSFLYTPNAGFSGTDSFTYRASNGSEDSSLATVTINVLPDVATPTVTDPAGPLTVPDATYTLRGTAEADRLVRVYRDVNNNNALDPEDEEVAAQQLMGGATTFAIETPLLANQTNNFLVTAVNSLGTESLVADVPTILQDPVATPTVTDPAGPLTVPDATYTLRGTAEADRLVRVYRDVNNNNALDPEDEEVAAQQLTGGATAFAIVTPLLANQANHFLVAAVSSHGTESLVADVPTIEHDDVAPEVTIERTAGQAERTTQLSLTFTVVFSETVTGFGAADVQLSGTAGADAVEVVAGDPADGTTYIVTVRGMQKSGTVLVRVVAGAAVDAAGNSHEASTDAAVDFLLVLFATGQGGGGTGQVKVFHAADLSERFLPTAPVRTPYPNFSGQVRVAVGDVNGDGDPDVLTAPGKGRPGRVRVFDGLSGLPLTGAIGSFFPFGKKWVRGLFVAAADITNDGQAEVIVGQDVGGGQVRVFDGATGRLRNVLQPFGPNYTGGVTVAAGNVDAQAGAELVVGRLTGATVVRVLRPGGALVRPPLTAFAGLTRGVMVAVGDVDGDGRAEVIAGLASRDLNLVRVLRVADGQEIASTFALNSEFSGGVRVGAVDRDGDGRSEVLIAAGPSPSGPQVKVLNGTTLDELDAFFAYDAAFAGGAFIG